MKTSTFAFAMSFTLLYGLPIVHACPGLTVHNRVVVQRAVVVEKVAVVAPVAVFAVQTAIVPTYSAVYTPPVAAAVAPAASPCDAQIQALRAEMAQMKAQLRAPGVVPSVPPPMGKVQEETVAPPDPKTTADPGAVILQNRCASCHEKTVAATKGGSFVMFDGARELELTNRQVNKVGRMIADDRMPKGAPPLTQDEKPKVGNHYDTQQ